MSTNTPPLIKLNNMKLIEYLQTRTQDVDVIIGGIDVVKFIPELFHLTPAGVKKFEPCFDMEVIGDTIIGNTRDWEDFFAYKNENKGNGGRLCLAWELLWDLAGYCSKEQDERWFYM